ncbi:MAG: serine hydrolase domain-containing protein [Pseudomonadota bacterium]
MAPSAESPLRRQLLRTGALLTAGLGLPGVSRAGAAPVADLADRLAPLLRGADGGRQLAGAALVVERASAPMAAGVVGQAAGLDASRRDDRPRPLTLHSKMRVASVSKMVVALTAVRLAEAGVVSLDRDLRPTFPMLTHPAFPDAPLSLRHLLAHTSTIRDPLDEAYYAVSPARIESILGPHLMNPKARRPPGAWFEYCNLNFGLAATVMERAAKERFDVLARTLVLEPAGLTGGFNWSAVAAADRRQGATLYRRFDDGWRVQTDGPEVLSDSKPVGVVEDTFAFADYAIGSNGTLFSPQGGLRINAFELAQLARLAGTEPALQGVEWRLETADGEEQNGDSWGGAFYEVGLGSYQWPAERSPIPGTRMIGHDGEAYGLYSGAWYLPELDASIGFAVTGTPAGEQPAGGSHPGYNRWSQAMFDIAATVLALR